jgi:hypothetical protein
VSAILVPVYRRHQITKVSPCTLGDPCPTCAQHTVCFAGNPCKSCRRGRWHECERASPAQPAFFVKFADAVRLVKNRLAKFIHHNSALQLKYSRLAHLRDASCKVDEHVVFDYAVGVRYARAIIDFGWAPGQLEAVTEAFRVCQSA